MKPKPNCGKVEDIDGNVYKTVTIGTQCWMIENLKVTHYRNGDAIPNITDDLAWNNLTTGAYCYYKNKANYSSTYGRLYNWYAVKDSRNIAPEGWHIPSAAEWTTLINFLGGDHFAGGKLKENGTMHWRKPNTGATNESGFTALPGGLRAPNVKFYGLGYLGYWWSSDIFLGDFPYFYSMQYDLKWATQGTASAKSDGSSVRCLKD